MTLVELRSYCDERARRWAEAANRRVDDNDRNTSRARMNEALEIGQYIARALEKKP